MNNLRILPLALFLGLIFVNVVAQEDLMDMLDKETGEQTDYTSATFKSTRIMNGHSIERMPRGELDFRISHRFGRLNSGAYELWGLDQANIHFGLDYGITDWLMAGVGRGTYEKTFDGFIKLSPLRQSKGAKNMPVSVSLFASTALTSVKWANPERTNYFSSRLSYVYQVLVARKFNQRFSAQITPTLVHRNLVATELDPNDVFALGAGGRVKITNRISFNAEYYYVFKHKDYLSSPVYNPLSVGFDIETGGHVFQLIFTNSLAMIEKGFITETTGRWLKGDIHFGFNISRVFMLGGK
jgi:opacity protein-like surface antigen